VARRGAAPPQGRFNAGQKVHTALQAGLMVVFTLSGVLIYLQEASARFRGTSAIVVHDVAMYVAVPLVIGHLFLALVNPSTRHSLRGMTIGTVRRDWARRHHPKWEREL
jgi:formate dehydrogenase subunit gamma